jgi:hypothetical protein
MNHAMNQGKDNSIRCLINLSAGTIATLTGETNYSKQEKIINDAYEWATENANDNDTWMTLWDRYRKETK